MATPIPLFQGLRQGSIDQLLRGAVQRAYRRNSGIGGIPRVISERDEATSLYIVLSGRLKVYRADAEGIMRDLVTGGYIEIDTFHHILVRKQLPQSW